MKKDYLKPEIVSVNMVAEANFLVTSGGDNSVPGGDDIVIPKSGEKRGEWGDVWGDKQ